MPLFGHFWCSANLGKVPQSLMNFGIHLVTKKFQKCRKYENHAVNQRHIPSKERLHMMCIPIHIVQKAVFAHLTYMASGFHLEYYRASSCSHLENTANYATLCFATITWDSALSSEWPSRTRDHLKNPGSWKFNSLSPINLQKHEKYSRLAHLNYHNMADLLLRTVKEIQYSQS